MKNNMIKQFIALVILLASPLVMAQQNFDDIEIQALKVRDNIYMLVGSGGNINIVPHF